MSKSTLLGVAGGAIGAAAIIALAAVAVQQYSSESPQEICEGTIRVLYDTMIEPAKDAETALLPFSFFSRLTYADTERNPRIKELRTQLNVLHSAYDQKNGPMSPEKNQDTRQKIKALEKQIEQITQALNDADVQEQAKRELTEPLEITFESTPRAVKYDPNTNTTWCAVRWSINRENNAGIRVALGQSPDPRRETVYTVQLNSHVVPLITLLEMNENQAREK